MVIRVIIAALVGGALAFAAGAAEHMFLGWVGRQMREPAEVASLKEALKSTGPGIYGFPRAPADFEKLPAEEQQKAFEKLNEEYKKGPSAYIVVAPTGEDLMSPRQLGLEFASNVTAAFLAAIIVAMTRPSVGFVGRWFAVVLMGLFSWVSINASYHIWYRYPWPWVQDELFCAALEWAVAGIAIAAIVRPRDTSFG